MTAPPAIVSDATSVSPAELLADPTTRTRWEAFQKREALRVAVQEIRAARLSAASGHPGAADATAAHLPAIIAESMAADAAAAAAVSSSAPGGGPRPTSRLRKEFPRVLASQQRAKVHLAASKQRL